MGGEVRESNAQQTTRKSIRHFNCKKHEVESKKKGTGLGMQMASAPYEAQR